MKWTSLVLLKSILIGIIFLGIHTSQYHKRHWNHSHITTSETEIPWKVLYKPGGGRHHNSTTNMQWYHNLWPRPTWTRPLVIYYYHWSRSIDLWYYLRISHLWCSHPNCRIYHEYNAAVANFNRTRSRRWRHPTIIDISNFITSFTRKITKWYWVSMQTNPISFITTASHNSYNAPNSLTLSMKFTVYIKFPTYIFEGDIASTSSSQPNTFLPS